MDKRLKLSLKEGEGIGFAVDIVILNKKGQVLLGERLAKAGFGTWGFPGGHIRFNEKIKECAKRELEEELGSGIKIEIIDKVISVRESWVPPYYIHHIAITLEAVYQEGEPKVMEPESCKKWQWFDFDNLPSPLFSGVEEVLKNYQQGIFSMITDDRR